jgi:threonine dehydrogenase-like Zn-dependent dehydrogenase
LTLRSTQVSTIPAALSATWDVARRRAAAVRLLGELPVATLATHEFAFESAADAYAALDRGQPGLLHAALVY